MASPAERAAAMATRPGLPVTPAMVHAAAGAIGGHVVHTPCPPAPALSELTGAEVYVKLESFQRTGSFKDRGACNRLLALDRAQREHGVVAASAGNHAQGVAYHARALGIPATIVVPEPTPFTKIARTRQLGATVLVHGRDVAHAADHARELAATGGLVLVHPYDDPLVVAGQGTVGLEILDAVPRADAVVVPVGGGGLLAGIAVAARESGDSIELVGVQSERFPAMTERFHSGSRLPVGDVTTIAEGIAVREPGVITTEIVRALVDDMVTVREPTIEEAMTHLLELEKTVAEGAGAAPLALLLEDPARFAGRVVVLVVSGGNVEPRVLASVILRGIGRQGRLVRFLVDADDSPGRLAELAGLIGGAGANIVEVEHGRLTSDIAVQRARVSFVVETVDAAHADLVLEALAGAGFVVERRGL